MELLISVIVLLIGFVLLIKGADFFVDGSSSVAKMLRIPSLVIGMTVVAMGTSLPELAVSVTASVSDSNSLAVSNVVGSNIFNLMVVLGASALFSSLVVSKQVLSRDLPFSIFCAILLCVCALVFGELNLYSGIVFLVIFIGFLTVLVRSALAARKKSADAADANETVVLPLWRSILYIVGGIVAIKFGGDFVVNSAVDIAYHFGATETLVGLTIVACGTSLPELVTSIVAARKDELDMAVGNAVGSNIFNILLILGVASVISPIPLIAENIIDIAILVGCSLLIMIFAWTKKTLSRIEGIFMLAIYAAFLVYIVLR